MNLIDSGTGGNKQTKKINLKTLDPRDFEVIFFFSLFIIIPTTTSFLLFVYACILYAYNLLRLWSLCNSLLLHSFLLFYTSCDIFIAVSFNLGFMLFHSGMFKM